MKNTPVLPPKMAKLATQGLYIRCVVLEQKKLQVGHCVPL